MIFYKRTTSVRAYYLFRMRRSAILTFGAYSAAIIDPNLMRSDALENDVFTDDLYRYDEEVIYQTYNGSMQEPLNRSGRLNWETQLTFPQTIEDLIGVTKVVLDPYRVIESLTDFVPDYVRAMAWYLALIVTFGWCSAVLVIGSYATFQVVKAVSGIVGQCSSCAKAIVSCCTRRMRKRASRRIVRCRE